MVFEIANLMITHSESDFEIFSDIPNPEKNIKSFDEITNQKLIICLGDSNKRKELSLILEARFPDNIFYTFIHKLAFIVSGSIIGEGSIIYPNVIIMNNVEIGKHSVININSSISHDCKIGDYFTCSPGVNIAGNVKIGNNVFIGLNVCIRDGISICDNVIIGMGAIITKNIIEEGVYIGINKKIR